MIKSSGTLSWIPQLITGFRLCAGPFFIMALLYHHEILALSIFVLASASDWLDGVAARLMKCETDFGKIFDPIADKFFILCVFIYYIFTYKNVFFAIGMIIISRDIFILSGAYVLRRIKPNIQLNPIYISKVNTFLVLLFLFYFTCVLVFAPELTFVLSDSLSLFGVNVSNVIISPGMSFVHRLLLNIGLALYYGSLFTTIVSGLFYVRIFITVYRASRLL